MKAPMVCKDDEVTRRLAVARWTKEGVAVWHASFGNVVIVLEHDARCAGRLRHDEFAGLDFWAPHGDALADLGHTLEVEHPQPATWVELADHHAQDLSLFLEAVYDLRVTWRVCHEAMTHVARRRSGHPLRAYLDGLTWDGTQRLETWLQTLAGVEDTPLYRAMGTAWMVCAVARVRQPGCQCDYALVLHGKQGRGKSSLFGVLGGEWYSDQAIDVRDERAGHALRGTWIHEFAELDALSRADVSATKAFLTKRHDRYRPPYGRSYVRIPRSSVFSGTTNDETFLSDPTGNRRFWVVRSGVIHLALAAELRDQLWAEAVAAYEAGAPRFLPRDLADAHAEDVDQYVHQDPWEEVLTPYLRTHHRVTPGMIYERLNKEAKDLQRTDQLRVSAILRRLGWERRRGRVGGLSTWVWEVPTKT